MTVSIRLKHSAVQDRAPQPADLANGELALNINENSPALYLKDSAGNVIKVAGVTGSATAPASPATGTVWIDSSQTPNVINVWDGTAWVPQAGATVASGTAPTAPVTGQIWVNTGVSPEVTQIWNGTGWITLDASGSDAQAISNDAKYATKAELAAEDLWDRTGTVVSPTNAGDAISGTGNISTGDGTHVHLIRPNGTGVQFLDPANNAVEIRSGTNDATGVKVTIAGDGKITTPSVTLDPGTTASPLVRDSNGNLGVGNSTPSSFNNDVNDVVLGNGAGGRGLTIFSGATGTGSISFHDAADTSISGLIRYGHTNNDLAFWTNGAQKAAIDASGRLLVGTTSGSSTCTATFAGRSDGDATPVVRIAKKANPPNGAPLGRLDFGSTNDTGFNAGARIESLAEEAWTENSAMGSRLSFSTTPSGSATPVERMRIQSGGATCVFGQNGVMRLQSGAVAGTAQMFINGSHTATGTVTGGTESFRVWTNGDIQNTNNSYTGISDIKLKENIVNAKSQWDDIKALRLVNYNFKAETGAETYKQLGLIAQEVEKVCPGLVGETKDKETVEVPVLDADGVAVMDEDGKPVVTTEERETGEVTKNVAYSVLYMKAVGALQEAMTRIEQLEAKVTALEGGSPVKSSDPGTKTRR